jgi:hypothetical protein
VLPTVVGKRRREGILGISALEPQTRTYIVYTQALVPVIIMIATKFVSKPSIICIIYKILGVEALFSEALRFIFRIFSYPKKI